MTLVVELYQASSFSEVHLVRNLYLSNTHSQWRM